MFIREDLVNEIKRIFNIEEFFYMRTTRKPHNRVILLFSSGYRNIAIEFEDENTYYMYEVKGELEYPGYFFVAAPIIKLSITEEETCLILEKIAISFPGKAFDATEELVISAIEKS